MNKSSLFNRCSITCLSLAVALPAFSISYALAQEDRDDNGAKVSACAGVLVGKTCITSASHDNAPATHPTVTTISPTGPYRGLAPDPVTNQFKQCAITGSSTSAPCFGNGDITSVHTAGTSDNKYELARLDSGVYSGHAIDLYGICRYVDKAAANNGNSIVVPFGDLNGWQSFTNAFASTLSGKAAPNDPDVNLSNCIRGGTVLPPAALATGDARNNMCGAAQLQTAGSITAPYKRYAANTSWTSPSVSYKCKSNADGATSFTETVTGTYLGNVAADLPSSSASPAGLTTSWSLSGITTSYNGVCGTSGAPAAAFRVAPTTGLCAVGSASAVTEANNQFLWNCSGGSDGNGSTACTAKVIIDAACGSSDKSSSLSVPTSGFCADGSTPAVSGNGPWSWTCVGQNGGNNATCGANKTINGTCGSANGGNFTSTPTGNLCASGTAGVISGGGPWSWQCNGQNNGTTAYCSANLGAVCGSSSGLSLPSPPTTNLCVSGTPSAIGQWAWNCVTPNGSSAACAASNSCQVTGAGQVNVQTHSDSESHLGSNNDCRDWSTDLSYEIRNPSSTHYEVWQTSQHDVFVHTNCWGQTFGDGYDTTNSTPTLLESFTAASYTVSTTSTSTPAQGGGGNDWDGGSNTTTDTITYQSCGTTTVTGTCGNANGTSPSIKPTAGLCSTGVPSVVSGNGPWTWTCAGSNGTTPASCSASLAPTNGICGTANGNSYTSTPSSNLCAYGTASTISGGGPWSWSCAGLNGGTTAYCSANLGAACGSANGGNYASAPSSSLCASGNASSVSGSGPWSWSCSTSNGSSASCSANQIINGACGAANGTTVSSAPSANLCSSGSASSVSGSGPWTWTCAGSNTGSTASCSASKTPSISVTRGQLHWDGNWTGNHFWCDPGYTLVSLHYDQGSSNNANWYECQGQATNAVIQSGSVPVVGLLHWDGSWTGNHYSCDPGYNLVSFHYDCGCSNNSDWYECQGTVNPNNYTPLTGPTHWDGNWTGNNFWCDGGSPFTPVGMHYDCTCSNNATWYSCQVVPVAGQCGSAASTYAASTPTSGLCSVGASSSVSQSGLHYNWTCSGTYGASAGSCQTPDCPAGYTLSGNTCVQQVCGNFAYTATCVGGSSNWQDCDIDNCGNVMSCYPDPGCS